MAVTTKTINPLHFEDLEPHRFEDLVRQLIYDFRNWRALEATGRQGSDDGFDARGWEICSDSSDTIENEDSADPADAVTEEDRVWLIQCKREKTITPKKLIGYLNSIKEEERSELYGMIFVAACNFSKKSRDDFRRWCIENGISEYNLWGKAELEDKLFQPRFDHLLFAYFGISLQIRKRASKTKLRSILATKRKAITHLGGIGGLQRTSVLLRDPDTKEYPYSGEIKDFDKYPTWRAYNFIGHYHSGIKILIRSHFGYLDDDGIKWDCDENIRTERPYDDPWAVEIDRDMEMRARHFWNKLPNRNRATLEVIGQIPYDDILAIDEHGDNYFKHPHIYVRFPPKNGPWSDGAYPRLVTYNPTTESFPAHRKDQIKYFPDVYPEIKRGEESIPPEGGKE